MLHKHDYKKFVFVCIYKEIIICLLLCFLKQLYLPLNKIIQSYGK
ncbi:hypothetical protein AC239_31100 [Bacteroides fragilis]|nr:hypothetical protein AC141_24210 [Bacteroides fragilis]OCR39103.1 hypothetical protein AC239_31100 [Bacteroides fragilis]